MAGGIAFDGGRGRNAKLKSEGAIVVCAQAVGYGPAAKALAIAEALRVHGEDCLFLGNGIAFELVSRSPDLIDAVQACAGDARAHEVVASARAVLSVMDVDFARLALDLDRPLYVADSLWWMRRPLPAEFLAARRYWMQNFPIVRERLPLSRAASIVGPIVPPRERRRESDSSSVVVNLGGCDIPYVIDGDDAGYSDFVVRGLLDSGLAHDAGTTILLMAGARRAETLRARYGGNRLEIVSLPHDEAQMVQSAAALVLTAPGATATLECFAAGTPTFFLPPQNFSQWKILAELSAAGLAPHAFQWADHLPAGELVEPWTQPERVSMFRKAIHRVVADAGARQTFRDKLNGVAAAPGADLARAQRAFFDSLGRNGAAQIAAELSEDLVEEGRWIASV